MNKKKNPLISIIIPTFNSANYLKHTINSVINQSYKNWELLIIDDCSTDRTFELLELFKKKNKKIRIFKQSKNKGPAFCRNFGINNSYGKYLAFLDSDDLWKKKKLSNQLKQIQEYNLDFSYTYYETIDEKNKILNKIKVDNFKTFRKFIHDTSIATSSMLIKRSSLGNLRFKKAGYGFDDYIFKAELIKKKLKSKVLNKFNTIYRIRSNSISRNRFQNFIWIWRINKNYFKLNIIENFLSVLNIGFRSIIKYKFK